MSAFMVSPTHVAALVRWYDTESNTHALPLLDDGRIRLANLLHFENARSINHRYASHPAELPHLFEAQEIDHAPTLTPIQAIKAAQCLRYQSCEHEAWDKSEANATCKRIINAAIGLLPGYDDAPWSIDYASDLKPQATR